MHSWLAAHVREILGRLGRQVIVMPAADRSLLDVYQAERPDLHKARVILREVIEGVKHLHERGLVHGDIKVRAPLFVSRTYRKRSPPLPPRAR